MRKPSEVNNRPLPPVVRAVLSNWAVFTLTVAYTFFITPIVVRALQAELYGVWSFLNGLVGYSDLLYLGLNSALVRAVARHRARGERQALNRVFSVVLSIYTVLGVLALTIALALGPEVPRMFAQPLTTDHARSVVWCCWLIGLHTLFVILISAWSAMLFGYGRLDLVNLLQVVMLVIRFVAIPLLIRGEQPLMRLTAVVTVGSGLHLACLAILAHRINPALSVQAVRPKRTELRALYAFGVYSFFIVFSRKLIRYADTTVIGMVLGASSVAVYSMPQQLIEYAYVFVRGFTLPFLPNLVALKEQDDQEGLRSAYLRNTRIALFLGTLLIGNLIFLGVPFINLWVGTQFGASAGLVILYLGLATLCEVVTIQVAAPFYQALNLLRVPTGILLCEAALNLALSIWLARNAGIQGVALATLLPAAMMSSLVLPIWLWRRLSLRPGTVLWQSIFPSLLLGGSVALLHHFVTREMPVGSYTGIALRGGVSIPVALIVFRLTFPEEDRRGLLRLVRKD